MSARGDRRSGKVKPACGFGNRAALENRYETLDVSDVMKAIPALRTLFGSRAGRAGRAGALASQMFQRPLPQE